MNETIDPSTCNCVCESGYTRCGSKCVDTNKDVNNCGGCTTPTSGLDHICFPDEKCLGGQCKCPVDKPDLCLFNLQIRRLIRITAAVAEMYALMVVLMERVVQQAGSHAGTECCPNGSGCCPDGNIKCVDMHNNDPSKLERLY